MKKVNVVAAVIKDNDKIFATQRGYGDYKDGWEFPGGKIEQGESPEAALIREIKEELDSDIQVDSLIDIIEYDYPNFHLSMKCYWCALLSKELHLLEHEDSKWLAKTELNTVDWLPADKLLLDKIVETWEDNHRRKN